MDENTLLRMNAARLNDRAVDEMIGLCRGLLADGEVNAQEASYLRNWIENNRALRDIWPANVLFARLSEMLLDGKLDADEERELLTTLLELTGGATSPAEPAPSTALPFCNPAPDIEFSGRKFCMTGKFVLGTRSQVESTIKALSGRTGDSPSFDTDYLVIGSVGSPAWIHSTHGRKIEKAVELRQQGRAIAIIGEEHLARFLPAQ